MDIYKILRKITINFPLRGMRRIAKSLANSDSNIDYEFVVPFYTKEYSGKLSDYIDWNVYFFGAYEKPLIELIFLLLKEREDNLIAIDIGANVGHHSLALSVIAKEVHSFEPYPPLCKRFEERINQTNTTNIYLHQFALGDKNDTIDFFPPSTSNKGQGSFIRCDSKSNSSKPIKLKTRLADEFISDEKINKIDFIKIDVEGFEPNVLKGLNLTLKKNKPILVIEKSPENKLMFSNISRFLSYLPNGYTVYYLSQINSIFVKHKLKKIAESYFEEFTGNLICIPSSYDSASINVLLRKTF